MRVGEVVDACGDTSVAIGGTHDHAADHFGVFALGTGMGTIFAITGQVKDRPQFVLQGQRLVHQLFRTGVVIDGRQDGKGFFAGKEHVPGMLHEVFLRFQWGDFTAQKSRRHAAAFSGTTPGLQH